MHVKTLATTSASITSNWQHVAHLSDLRSLRARLRLRCCLSKPPAQICPNRPTPRSRRVRILWHAPFRNWTVGCLLHITRAVSKLLPAEYRQTCQPNYFEQVAFADEVTANRTQASQESLVCGWRSRPTERQKSIWQPNARFCKEWNLCALPIPQMETVATLPTFKRRESMPVSCDPRRSLPWTQPGLNK